VNDCTVVVAEIRLTQSCGDKCLKLKPASFGKRDDTFCYCSCDRSLTKVGLRQLRKIAHPRNRSEVRLKKFSKCKHYFVVTKILTQYYGKPLTLCFTVLESYNNSIRSVVIIVR